MAESTNSMAIFYVANSYWLLVSTISKNMKDNGKDDIPYMKWKIKHVWNHQPVMLNNRFTWSKNHKMFDAENP